MFTRSQISESDSLCFCNISVVEICFFTIDPIVRYGYGMLSPIYFSPCMTMMIADYLFIVMLLRNCRGELMLTVCGIVCQPQLTTGGMP